MDLALLCACLLLAAEPQSPSAQATSSPEIAATQATIPGERVTGEGSTPTRRPRQQVPFPPRTRGVAPTLPSVLDGPIHGAMEQQPTLAEPTPAGPAPTDTSSNHEIGSQAAGRALEEPANMPERSGQVQSEGPEGEFAQPARFQSATEVTPVPKPADDATLTAEDGQRAVDSPASAPDGEQSVLPRILPANAERSAVRRNQEKGAAAAASSSEPSQPAMQRQTDIVDPFSIRPSEPSTVVPAGGVEPALENPPAGNRLMLGGERGQDREGWEHANPDASVGSPAQRDDQPQLQRNPLDAAPGPDRRYEDFGPNQGGASGGTMQPREPLRTEFDSRGFSDRLLDEPGPIQRTTGEGIDDRRLPPASHDSGALVPVQPQALPTEPRHGLNAHGVQPEASPRAVLGDRSHSQVELAQGQSQPDIAKRLVAELFGQIHAQAGQGGDTWPASSRISLQDVLQRSSQPAERLALVQNYWRMAAVAAEYQAIANYAGILQQLSDAYRAEPGGVPPEVAAALATAKAQQQEKLVAWAEASNRLGVGSTNSGASTLLRPSDLPHAGRYRTEFEHLYANRPAPPRVTLLNQLLPYRYQAVQRRADAVAAATDQAVAADEAFRRGELTLTRFLAALRRETEEQLRFLHDVQVYNDEIAEYAISATGGQLPLATLAETLVKEPQAARQSASGTPQVVTPGATGAAPGGYPTEVLPPEAVQPQPATPAGPQPQRGGIPTEPLPVPNTAPRSTTPGSAPNSPFSPGAAVPATPGGVVQASGAEIDELPGRSILKATSTLPANGSRLSAPASPSTLRPIPQAVQPMSGTTMTPAPFPQPHMAVPLQSSGMNLGPQPTPAAAPSSGQAMPASSGSQDGWRESQPDGRQPQRSQPPTVPPTQDHQIPSGPALDRMTLRPAGQDAAALLSLGRLAGAPAAECAANLREAFFAALPSMSPEQPLTGAQLSLTTAAAHWWTLLERLADERSLQSFLIQLDELQNAASQHAHGNGDYTMLAVRTARFSLEADLAAAQAATTTARAMLREVSPTLLSRLPKQPRLPADASAAQRSAGADSLERLQAQYVEAAAVAVAAHAAAVDMARRQWQQGGRPIEEVLDALSASRQAHITWLTAVTRYQTREL